jgi:thioredoxin 2
VSEGIVVCPNCGTKNRIPAAASGVARCATCHEPLPWIAEADDDSFAEVSTNSAMAVLVDLWAPWCGPCRMLEPVLEEVARSFAGRLKIVRVNVDKATTVAARFDASSIPTLLVMRNGEVLDRIVGALPSAALSARVSAALGEDVAAR